MGLFSNLKTFGVDTIALYNDSIPSRSAITINSEREDVMDFSYPYYNSGLQIMTRSSGGQVAWGLLSMPLSPRVLQIILGFAIVMFIIGNLVWLIERKEHSEEFPQSYLKGVWEGV